MPSSSNTLNPPQYPGQTEFRRTIPITRHLHSSPCKGSKTTSSHPMQWRCICRREQVHGYGVRIPRLQMDERDGMFVTRGEVMYGASCRGLEVERDSRVSE